MSLTAARITCDDIKEKLAAYHILDCSVGETAFLSYQSNKIPGAIFLKLDSFRDTSSPFPHMLPTEAQAISHLNSIGVGKGKPIICYDVGNNMGASRAAFVLKAWGFQEIYVLQGGLSAWTHGTETGVN